MQSSFNHDQGHTIKSHEIPSDFFWLNPYYGPVQSPGASNACVLASHATREKEGSMDDPVKDEMDFVAEMKRVGFQCNRRYIQPLTVPSEEWLTHRLLVPYLYFSMNETERIFLLVFDLEMFCHYACHVCDMQVCDTQSVGLFHIWPGLLPRNLTPRMCSRCHLSCAGCVGLQQLH